MRTYLNILLHFFLSSVVLGQERDYAKFIQPLMVDKTVTDSEPGIQHKITYMGAILDSSGETIHYVVKEFRTVKVVNGYHGHSLLVFLDANKHFEREYDCISEEQLPVLLKGNHLIFYYTDNSTRRKKRYLFKIGRGLPTTICVAPDNCI